MQLIFMILNRLIREGRLAVIDAGGRRREFGDGEGPAITVRLRDRRTEWALLTNPQLALGEAYMDGRLALEDGDIAGLLDLLTRNLRGGFGGWQWELVNALRMWRKRLTPANTLSRARRNVAHHYDLSAGLYDLFLDADKQYSCAFFETPNDTLEQAQANKRQRIAAKLLLNPNLSVLDIGSGWGGLGLHMARQSKVKVTGVTLSEEQLKIARERAQRLDLADRVRFELQDYRAVKGRFDRIVSVGMFEHVGLAHYREFFSRVADLLTDDGLALIHAIGRSDGPGATNAWIAKYIFPGGYAPALSEVLPAVEKSGLIVTDIEILRLHYARTLAEWRRRFVANWERAKRLYDERFCRMWEFYLAGSEMAFRNQGHFVFQIQLAKRIDSLPLVRDYMAFPAPAAQRRSAA
ncbi:MAG TPA: cyclopropane-fatty-acyl-phospholipid synthase family protein [Rhizomicrobium sp.]|nr:cyclopropane-fatty-acyl-phospholipid synthase family protein [Rhizomicrobium sp.]